MSRLIKSEILSYEDKQKWIKALRSGDFKQGKIYLRCNDCYCCLGVYGQQKNLLNPHPDAPALPYSTLCGEIKMSGCLPNMILETKIQRLLQTMNDSWDMSFDRIADFIEHFVQAKDE